MFDCVAISRGHKMICALCKRSDETKKTGTLSSKEDLAAHQNCLLFASGLCCKNTPEFDDLFGFSVEDVKEEVIRGHKLVCYKCKKRGATAGCEVGRCKKSYHYPCAVEDGAETFEEADNGIFGLYCPQHYVKMKENGSSTSDSSSAALPETSDAHPKAGSSKKRPSPSANQLVPAAKRVSRKLQESSDSDGQEAEEDSSIFAPLESDIDEESQEEKTRKAGEDPEDAKGSECKMMSADETSLLPVEGTNVGTRTSVIVSKEASVAVNENGPSPEQSCVHSPLPQPGAGLSPPPDLDEAPCVGTSLLQPVSAPEPSIGSASFWKSCNEAGCTKAIFTAFIQEMSDIAGRIQSDQASQEDYDLALSVMQASGRMVNIVTKQNEEIQQKQMELDKAAASMKKVLSALKK